MGYYTRFNLSFEAPGNDEWQIQEDLQKLLEIQTDYKFNSDLSLDDAKWYHWESDMIEISKQLPTIKFSLEGDGEEQGDHWKAYFYNGKKQISKAIVTFEPCKLW